MSDTPETDAALYPMNQVDIVWPEFARKLERERDEARRKLNNLDVTAIHSCHNECQSPICVLRRERDEAREALMKIEDLFVDGTDVYADREKMGMIARNALEGAK